MLSFNINGYDFGMKVSTFPGGEEHVDILIKRLPRVPDVVTVTAKITSSTELMRLALLTDALKHYARNYKACTFVLNIPYLPYARQDRRCKVGEAFSLKVFASLLNSMEYDRVKVTDCHSEVGLALIDNVEPITQREAIKANLDAHRMVVAADMLVAPDAGSAKKITELAEYYGKPVLQCLKTRTADGRIEVQVLEDTYGKNLLVVDDICDGGGTFLALATALGATESLSLLVTHGIFSKGKDVLLEAYTEVRAIHEF